MRLRTIALLTMLLLMGIALVPPTKPAAVNAQDDPFIVTALPYRLGNTPQFADPVTTANVANADYVINTFLQLVRVNPSDPTQIEPSLAQSWDITGDGSIYTFYLRDDVYWVSYNAATSEIIRQRAVTAGDVVFGVYRICDSIDNGFFATDIIGPTIDGCLRAMDGRDPAEVVQVVAIDDRTVQFTLSQPGGHFLRMAALVNMTPFPPESVTADDIAWGPGTVFWTNGPFVPTVRGFLRNPYLPEPVAGPGNIDLVAFDQSAAGPFREVEFPISGVNWLNFSADRAPMDNVHLRRAFAAAFVRPPETTFAKPMYHLAPEILFGGIPDTDIGLGYDLDYAREQMELAGYPDCEGMPTIIFNNETRNTLSIELSLDEFAAMYAPLGCQRSQFVLGGSPALLGDNEGRLLLPEQRPHVFVHSTWYPDYGDVDNYINILECGTNNTQNRRCTELDTLIQRARRSTDGAERIQLYRDIMEGFFGRDGEFPLIPVSRYIQIRDVPRWVDGPFDTNGLVNGERFDFYTVDIGSAPASVLQSADQATIATSPDATSAPDTTATTTSPTATSQSATTAAATPTRPTSSIPLPPFDRDAPTCRLLTLYIVAVRAIPDPDADIVRYIDYAIEVDGVAQGRGPDGFVYWQLPDGGWVRDDVVREATICSQLPTP